ncbi:hypothetical protein VCRA2121O391_200089 [Vibrio crassostreae]|nr:hypothetical protein VCRA2113O324_170015 [Vibrio crassostreae]CAK1811778.1 hypothetical protein VCRA2119O145_190087 [Vibrio crassostreae]CAK1818933.1 hypothetical protein VCRA2111O320_180116 [Vibrio crassostreae]CAK1910038.1 hypothetical protein VCRA2113O356_220092 [Vibrio crassostreae]CAK2321429.1 hypothetical protein VCRA2119O386_230092 [Vibrio crassostreae]
MSCLHGCQLKLAVLANKMALALSRRAPLEPVGLHHHFGGRALEIEAPQWR